MNRAIIDIIYIGHVEHVDDDDDDNDMSRVTVARTCTNQVRGRRSDRRSVSPVQQLERLDVS